MSAETILTLVAILIGPIAAVLITRWLDSANNSKQRKFELFKALMQTRGIRLDPVHVSALNIVELEFFKYPKVRASFKSYIEHLSSPLPSNDEEEQNKYYEQRSDLFMDLLQEIGNTVGYRFDKRELDRRSYVPRGWNDDHFVQQNNAKMLNQMLQGLRPLPVANFTSPTTKFPAPPEVSEEADNK